MSPASVSAGPFPRAPLTSRLHALCHPLREAVSQAWGRQALNMTWASVEAQRQGPQREDSVGAQARIGAGLSRQWSYVTESGC